MGEVMNLCYVDFQGPPDMAPKIRLVLESYFATKVAGRIARDILHLGHNFRGDVRITFEFYFLDVGNNLDVFAAHLEAEFMGTGIRVQEIDTFAAPSLWNILRELFGFA